MDEFGVLVKRYGINPNKGKSAPMAGSKKSPKPLINNNNNHNFINQDPNFLSKPVSQLNSGNGSVLDYQNDDIFGFNLSNKGQNYEIRDVFDGVFEMATKNNSGMSNGGGGGLGFDFDVESVFKGSLDSGAKLSGGNGGGGGDDIWGFSEKSSGNVEAGSGDLLSSDPVGEFWGKMAKLSLDQRGVQRLEENKGFGDDLLPGFGMSSTANDRAQTSARDKNSSVSSLEELEDFVTNGIRKGTNGHGGSFTAKSEPEKTYKQKPLETNFFDFDASVNGDNVQKEETVKMDFMFQDEAPDLDLFFRAPPKKSAPISEQTSKNLKTPEEPNLFSGTAFGMNKKISPSDYDFSLMFEGSPASGVFQEIEGESEERRSLRFARFQRANARMEHALAEMNQREFRAQQEQEEKHRIADAMDMEMKQWAAGKEGNLRALLSSLQQVLGPESGWRPVSLTDLITSSQVKLAYRKAALCVHPDKVQQRGANLQQKFVAEKTFDLLQEAWNKFSTEELR